MVAPFLLLLACSGSPEPPAAAGLDPEGQAALDELRAALDSDSVEAVAQAARKASAWQGQDPDLDTALGDALANHLLRVEEGVALLRGKPRPQDPTWRRAAADASIRLGERAWIDELLPQKLDLLNPVVDQLTTVALTDRSIDHALFVDVVQDCMLLDERPTLGRRIVDLPLPQGLSDVLPILGADRVLVARTTVQRRVPQPGEQRWHCAQGWLTEPPRDRIPEPFPPRGLIVAATDGPDRVWLELAIRHDVPWATVASDAQAAARWIEAASMLTARRQAGDSEEQARAAVLERFGSGLVVHGAGTGGAP